MEDIWLLVLPLWCTWGKVGCWNVADLGVDGCGIIPMYLLSLSNFEYCLKSPSLLKICRSWSDGSLTRIGGPNCGCGGNSKSLSVALDLSARSRSRLSFRSCSSCLQIYFNIYKKMKKEKNKIKIFFLFAKAKKF